MVVAEADTGVIAGSVYMVPTPGRVEGQPGNLGNESVKESSAETSLWVCLQRRKIGCR